LITQHYQLINGKLFYMELDKGEKRIQEKICDLLGHDEVEETETHDTFTIETGVCRRCGHGLRFWELSKKESERYQAELKELC